jgi:hypothetical protein
VTPIEMAPQRAVRVVPRPCQNGRETAVISGRSRTLRTASDLGMGWLTRCVKHTSKQRVTCASWPALSCRIETYLDLGNVRPSETDLARLQSVTLRVGPRRDYNRGERWRSRSSVR